MLLRDYQREAIDALQNYFVEKSGNPLLVLPTAAGKSVIQAIFVKEVLEQYPNERIMLLSHVKELLSQNASRIYGVWPDAPIGVFSAGLNRRQASEKITVASIQSVYKCAPEIGAVGLIIVDECHLIPHKSEGMYRQFLADMRYQNPYVKVIGLSATPWRMKSGSLTEGEGALFNDIAFEVPISRLLKEGYLSQLISKNAVSKVDTRDIKMSGGEFQSADSERVFDTTDKVGAACDEMILLGQDRKSWLIFCAGVKHAAHVMDALIERGIGAATVTGETHPYERDMILRDFKSGKIQALTNCDVLTTGFDAPNVDLLAMLRPTASAALYVQIVGRGMRIAPGKQNCLVLDFAGNIMRHGSVDQVKPPRIGKKRGAAGEGIAPMKECPTCQSLVPAVASVCFDCGHEFPRELKHETEASTLNILSSVKPVNWNVDEVLYQVHNKAGSPPSMRVEYTCGLNRASEWICFEHEGFARSKAVKWWKERMGTAYPAPVSVTHAIAAANGMPKPKEITVITSGKYPQITGYNFHG